VEAVILRILAIVFGVISGACFYAAYRLYIATQGFIDTNGYAVSRPYLFSYATRYSEADGSGIYALTVIFALVGLFFAKFTFKLWRKSFPED
jgi:hypothetical protein